jgi:three-Cys-motif partner protein
LSEQDGLFSAAEFDTEFDKTFRVHVPRPRTSADEAREFGGWTGHKLDILTLYLKMYRRVAGGGTYIDGFAGTGEIRIDGVKREGSAAIALDSTAFKVYRFYERPRQARRLGRWVETEFPSERRPRIEIVPGDCNETLLRTLGEELIPKSRPCFAFLDPNSTELNWSTVAALATYKADVCDPPDKCKVELWILLNTYQVLMRLMGKKPHETVLNRWLGGEAGWRDLWEAHKGAGLFAARYAERLKSEFGYGEALPLTVRNPKNGAPQYHMIHASDHPAAFSFMRWAKSKAHPEDSAPAMLPGFEGL